MSDVETNQQDADCDHRYELKGLGYGNGGLNTVAGFQCTKCGRAFVKKAPTNPSGCEDLYSGWFK